MSANPALVQMFNGELCPAPFQAEVFVLRRDGVELQLEGVQTHSGKWTARGVMFLSNVRLVFVAEKADASGLAAFDFPLVYMHKDDLNQPIFGCNNLAGLVWPAVAGGGPGGANPPHKFRINFKEGGIGTFYPLYYALTQRAKRLDAEARAAALAPSMPQEQQYVSTLQHKAFVDPNDPTTIYLTQPVDETQRLQQMYPQVYASNYGQDESYEPVNPAARPQ